jgi:hypothetical protein
MIELDTSPESHSVRQLVSKINARCAKPKRTGGNTSTNASKVKKTTYAARTSTGQAKKSERAKSKPRDELTVALNRLARERRTAKKSARQGSTRTFSYH